MSSNPSRLTTIDRAVSMRATDSSASDEMWRSLGSDGCAGIGKSQHFSPRCDSSQHADG
jgi:hypothetical protein